MSQIRGKAIGIFEHERKFLFTVCYEKEKDELFYIPAGGGIEFGEHSLVAAIREILEEIGQEIENERLPGITENIFASMRRENMKLFSPVLHGSNTKRLLLLN